MKHRVVSLRQHGTCGRHEFKLYKAHVKLDVRKFGLIFQHTWIRREQYLWPWARRTSKNHPWYLICLHFVWVEAVRPIVIQTRHSPFTSLKFSGPPPPDPACQAHADTCSYQSCGAGVLQEFQCNTSRTMQCTRAV